MKDLPNILQTGRDIISLDDFGFFRASIKVSSQSCTLISTSLGNDLQARSVMVHLAGVFADGHLILPYSQLRYL
jgi:hypothetical protein